MRRRKCRIIVTVLAWFIAVSPVLFAQQSVVDSLKTELARSRQDTMKARICIILARMNRQTSPDEAMKFAEEGLRISERARYKRGIWNAAATLGDLHLDRDEYELAQKHFELALKASTSAGHVKGQARAWAGFCSVQTYQGHDDEGLPHAVKALKLYEAAGDRDGIEWSLREIAMIHQRRGRFKDALAYCERRIRLEEEIGDSAEIGYALLEYAQQLAQMARNIEAKPYLERSLAVQENIRNRDGMAWALLLLGHVTRGMGNIAAAREYYTRGMRLREEMRDEALQGRKDAIPGVPVAHPTSDDENVVTFEVNLGSCCVDEGRFDEAMTLFQKALNFYEARNNKDGIAVMSARIGWALCKLSQCDQALDYYRRSLKILEESGNIFEKAHVLHSMGAVFSQMKKEEEAIGYFRQSMEAYKQTGNALEVSRQSGAIGECLFALGRYKEALSVMEECLVRERELKDTALVACDLHTIGRIYDRMGNSDTAIALCREAYELLRHVDDPAEMSSVVKSLAGLYAKKGRHDKAYEFVSAHFVMKDSLYKESSMKTVHEMIARYDAEKRDQQIALLEKDKRVAELEMRRQRDALLRASLERERQRQQLDISMRDREIAVLEQQRLASDLRLKTAETKSAKDSVTRLSELNTAHKTVEDKNRMLVSALLVGIGLSIVIGFLGMKRVQLKKAEAVLRAETAEYQARAAEYQAQAAEAQATALAAEAERKEAEAQKRFTAQLIESQEQERKRIAAELHDSLSQDLLVIKNRVMMAANKSDEPDQVRSLLSAIGEMATTSLQDVRAISRNLRPHQLERLGLTETIGDAVRAVTESSSTRFTVDIANIDGFFAKDQEINIYRIVQETLNNIIKHAQADEAMILVLREAEEARIVVEDNGRGFDEATSPPGLGLHCITERVRMMGGTLVLKSSPGKGTSIRIDLPAAANASATLQTPSMTSVQFGTAHADA